MKKKRTSRSAFFNLPARMCFALVCTVAISAHADVITVTNTNDSGPGSLRQALADANDDDTIDFDPALNGQAIRLTGPELVIDKNISISGPGPELLAVCRDGYGCFRVSDHHRAASKNARERQKVPDGTDFRIFHVTPGHVANIAGLTISYGYDTGGGILNDQSSLTVDSCTLWANYDDSTGGGGGIRNSGAGANLAIINSTVTENLSVGGPGGGIYNDGGTVVITNSTVSYNESPHVPVADGGGIQNRGTMDITNSVISGNHAGFRGGGIINWYGPLTITNSTVTGNLAGSYPYSGTGYGGGIYSIATLTITNSTISNNTAHGEGNSGWGGGVSTGIGSAEIINSTISGNFADRDAGGIDNSGPLQIVNSTISNNSANGGAGGIRNAGALEIGNAILNAGQLGANIFNNGGTVTSHGYNLSSDDAGGYLNGPGDQINTDPLLGPLQDNGGPTFTHALLPGSPAIDAGDPNFTPPPFYDQRGPGFDRVVNGRIEQGLV